MSGDNIVTRRATRGSVTRRSYISTSVIDGNKHDAKNSEEEEDKGHG